MTRTVPRVAAVAAGLVMAGCGGSHAARAPATSTPSDSAGPPSGDLAAFRWLRPAPPPPGWATTTNQAGHAVLAYPPDFKPVIGNPQSVNVALHHGRAYYAYLSMSPQQDGEQPTGWTAFRLQFERQEGDRIPRALASAQGLQFRGGRGSCVIDDYTSHVNRQRNREIACLVIGPHASTVLAGAAPLREWRKRARVLEQALSAFSAT